MKIGRTTLIVMIMMMHLIQWSMDSNTINTKWPEQVHVRSHLLGDPASPDDSVVIIVPWTSCSHCTWCKQHSYIIMTGLEAILYHTVIAHLVLKMTQIWPWVIFIVIRLSMQCMFHLRCPEGHYSPFTITLALMLTYCNVTALIVHGIFMYLPVSYWTDCCSARLEWTEVGAFISQSGVYN